MPEPQAPWLGEHPVTLRDLEAIARDTALPWERLRQVDVLVTGASGSIGSALVKALMYASDRLGLNIHVVAHGRSEERLSSALHRQLPRLGQGLTFLTGDVTAGLEPPAPPRCIVHAASLTASRQFVEQPVETMRITLEGTTRVLECAKKAQSRSVVYISTMEVYGDVDHELVREEDTGPLDPLALRNSYPMSKRMAEALCVAYAREYHVPVKIVRPTLTFGAALTERDNRVYAQFVRAVLAGKPLTLHTTGGTKRDYLHIYDAVRGILTVLLLGKDGEAYNLSNPDTYCSIYEMAQLVAGFGPKTEIVFDIDSEGKRGYLPEVHRRLDIAKLRALHDFPLHSLRDCFDDIFALTGDVEK
ncbi:MAG: NAD-dependent epimerase/dehydratase family protein [Desulfovibrio sp.]|nr:NAD-dependent epimerase/dehydratase family protein [Desulfovibrio sp.]